MKLTFKLFLFFLIFNACKTTQVTKVELTEAMKDSLKKEIIAELKLDTVKTAVKMKKVITEEMLPIHLKENVTNFKFAGFNKGKIYYTFSGNLDSLKNNIPFFRIFKIFSEDSVINSMGGQKAFFESNFNIENPGFKIKENSLQSQYYLSFNGFSAIGLKKIEEKEISVHFQILFGKGFYIITKGFSNDGEKYIPDFIKMSKNLIIMDEK